MRKLFANLICAFVPSAMVRRQLRARICPPPPPSPALALSNSLSFEAERARYLAQIDRLAGKLHPEIFTKYKNAFSGRDVVLIATGPTLADFKPIKGAVYVGLNRAFEWRGAKLDFLFMQDYCGLDYIEDAAKHPAKKFYGILRHDVFSENGRSPMIPESIAIRHGAARYYVNAAHDCKISRDLDFAFDISAQALACWGSVAFPALQFILYGNPRRVYLVGCDTNHSGYFNGVGVNKLGLGWVMRGWRKMKEFADAFYPETEIISVNPVGLRGMFKDLDQKGGK